MSTFTVEIEPKKGDHLCGPVVIDLDIPKLTNDVVLGHVRAALHRALPAETALAVMARIDELFSAYSLVLGANALLIDLRKKVMNRLPRNYNHEGSLGGAIDALGRALKILRRE